MSKKRFYYKGVFFDNQEDFFKYSSLYENSKITEVSLKEMLSNMEKEIWLNLLNPKEIEITNQEMQGILSKLILELILELRKHARME